MKEVLNNSKDGLRIFQENFKVDYSLPKYDKSVIKYKENIIDTVNKVEAKPKNTYDIIEKYSRENLHRFEDNSKLDTLLQQLGTKEVDLEFFKSLDADGLTVLIGEQKKHQISKGIHNVFFSSGDSLDSSLSDIIISDNLRQIEEQISTKTIEMNGKSESIKKSWKTKFKDIFKRKQKLEEVKSKEPEYIFDVLEFFKLVKMNTLKESSTYYGRLEDYLKAIRQAQQMGQQALVDKLLGNLFVTKYESILKAQGCNKRISESLLVEFIKKTEKGVSLSYISNYTRPIPQEVIDKKLEADKLKVFDNYCILYYDPDGKVYKETAVEHQKAREKREDPILFGMIEGVRCLYYITDWIDEYCDLTLDKFVQAMGIKKESLEIESKIKIW